jgi:hypothetical protein
MARADEGVGRKAGKGFRMAMKTKDSKKGCGILSTHDTAHVVAGTDHSGRVTAPWGNG